MRKHTRQKQAKHKQEAVTRALWIVLGLNLTVASAKLLYGWVTRSAAMMGDGFHSFSDAASNVVGLTAVVLAYKPADRLHPYGHRKFETLATTGIAALLLFTATELVRDVVRRIQDPVEPSVTGWSFAVMLGTMAVNTGAYLYESRAARRWRSEFLAADAQNRPW